MNNDTLLSLCARWQLDPAQDIVEIPDFGRDALAALFAQLGFKGGAEIGVQLGDYSEVLCRANPQATVWSVDSWRTYAGYHFITTQAHQDANRARAIARLAPYHNSRIMQMDSLNAAEHFRPGSLDWVYIDANHDYLHVSQDLEAWGARVRAGGIVAGHDYVERTARFKPDMQVVRALRDYTAARGIRPLFLLGRKAILPNEIRERPRSWMFFNP